MSTLVAICYPDEHRAVEVLTTLRKLSAEHLVDLEDAVYVTKDAKGKVKLHQSLDLTAAGAIGGTFWGMLIGMIFFMPLVGAAVGAATGALSGSMSDYGIDDKFMKEVAGEIQPGNSAIFVLIKSVTRDKVEPEIAKFGGKILHTSLSKDAEAKLQAALDSGAAATPPAVTT